MRKIINSTYITLDGVIKNPHLWPSPDGHDDNANVIQTKLLLACDAVIMGRRTYEGFAPVWPTRSGDPFSDKINAMPKYVVSTTMGEPLWNNTTVIRSDVAGAVARLKSQAGGDIVQYGFGSVSRELLKHGLLDELRLWGHPLFIGKAGPQDLLFRECEPARLRLVDTKALKTGIVILNYQIEQ